MLATCILRRSCSFVDLTVGHTDEMRVVKFRLVVCSKSINFLIKIAFPIRKLRHLLVVNTLIHRLGCEDDRLFSITQPIFTWIERVILSQRSKSRLNHTSLIQTATSIVLYKARQCSGLDLWEHKISHPSSFEVWIGITETSYSCYAHDT